MKLTKKTLRNGLQVALVRTPNNQGTSYVQIYVNVGSNHETDETKGGISHLLEHMAFKGTATKTAKEMAEEMEITGSSCNAFTSNKNTGYNVTGLSDHTKLSIEFLADIIRNSTFPEEELAKEREVVEQEMLRDATDIDSIAYETSIGFMFPNQTYGRTIIGKYENVSKITRQDLLDYVTKHYTPDNMVLVCGCNQIDEAEYFELAETLFGSMVNSGIVREDPPIDLHVSENHITDDMFDKQSEVAIMYPYQTDDKKKFVASMLAYYLSRGQSSPLFDRLREQEPLCYGVSATILGHFHDKQHLFGLVGATSPEKRDRFIAACIEELEKVAAGRVDFVGWERTINTIKLSNIMSYNSQSGVVSLAYNSIRNGTPFDTMEERLANYRAITESDMIDFAKELVASSPSIQTYGGALPVSVSASSELEPEIA